MKLAAAEMTNSCRSAIFDFTTTEEIEPLTESIIGQEKAVKAVELGLQIKQDGYNIFIVGLTGTGRTTYARTIALEKSRRQVVPPDLCYVFNYQEPACPLILELPVGKGLQLRQDLEKLIDHLKEEIPRVFDGEEYEKKKNQIMGEYQQASNSLLEELESKIRTEGFILQNTGQDLLPAPLPIDQEGKPLTQEIYQQIPEAEKKRLKEKSQEIQQELEKIRRLVRKLQLTAREKINQLDHEIGRTVIKPIFNKLQDNYQQSPQVLTYLASLESDIMAHLARFKGDKKEKNPLQVFQQGDEQSFFVRYQVNLLVNNSSTEGAPVIIESNPTYYNLFGKIEGKSQFGTVSTDFTMIKGGALHRANGGYLIINARDLLQKPLSWDTLKRTLLNQELVVENIGEQYRAMPINSLKPEPLPIKLKVILIGTPELYQLLYYYDQEFKKLFKIKADFDIEMERTEDNMKKFASVIAFISRREGLKHFTVGAVCRLIEYSSRLTANKHKLSTRFNEIQEIIFEAAARADAPEKSHVGETDVLRAIEEKEQRANLSEEKILEMIEKGHILITLAGQKLGQVNGLAVYQSGQYSFGRPSRITATTYLGQDGVINIEREVKLSGKLHNKGVMILTGYLGEKYAQDEPLSLSASLAFEQSYRGVDGDSASCAELVALLSSIAAFPLKQELALTGSMNQKGDVQPIGGVNEKIEGFYKVCKINGLTGKQGVVIPRQNVDNLMLKSEVIAAVQNEQFNIFPVSTIDEVIELMFGIPAAEVHHQVQESLRELARKTAEFGGDRG